MVKHYAFIGAISCALAMSACSQNAATLQGLGITNTAILTAAGKIDTANKVVVADIPQLCQLAAASAVVIGAGASTVSGVTQTQANKAAADVTAAANSPLCTQGLTGTIADAQTLAASINEVKAATGKSATAIASGS